MDPEMTDRAACTPGSVAAIGRAMPTRLAMKNARLPGDRGRTASTII